MKTQLLDHGYVARIETWGSDEMIIECARMSTAKGFQGWGPIHETSCAVHAEPIGSQGPCNCEIKAGDEKLLRHLWMNKHTTPFEFAGATLEVQAPLIVFREWQRHRTKSYSEQSARYVEMPELWYTPSKERLSLGGQSTTNKQGSGELLPVNTVSMVHSKVHASSQASFDRYHELLHLGTSRELARLVLPVSTYSRMRVTANLLNWCRFLALRLPATAQWEIRQYAAEVRAQLEDKFPRTIGLLIESMRTEALPAKAVLIRCIGTLLDIVERLEGQQAMPDDSHRDLVLKVRDVVDGITVPEFDGT